MNETFKKLFHSLSFEDLEEDFRSNLKGKNNFKKLNVLNIIKIMVDVDTHIKDESQGKQLAKLVLHEIDSNENKVREKACELIANMKDKYNAYYLLATLGWGPIFSWHVPTFFYRQRTFS